ncbi:thioredoxin domain-containing protein [Nocardioides sp. TF02-7]|uniref:DsbA family protein n=1 Tax=Nocardioides sp. TF02-7 TaxID=2917724 RepID=UPI001F05AFD9|nr:thioredoxin domain-containing protein [Nocardioides sp. TF02-7]UMG94417.1 DsbA family protein [Nocardioides sp. TF02-7]
MPDTSPTSDSRGSRRLALLLTVIGLVAVAVLVAVLVIPGDDDTSADGDPDRGTSSTSPSASASPTDGPTDGPTDSTDGTAGTSPSPSLSTAPEDLTDLNVRRQPDDPMAKGDVDAPVVMVVYSDFQCPHCATFAEETVPVLERRYVESGVLRIEWRDFPYLGQGSLTAALAGRAAAAQGRFWEFHDAVYAAQPRDDELSGPRLERIARDLGLDMAEFRTAAAAPETLTAVETDVREGQSIGVQGTPSFLVNGIPMIGAQPAREFSRVIEEAAAAAS